MNTDIKVTGKELGINDDLTFELKGQMKIKDVDFDVEYKDATNLDDLKFILKSEVENNLKYTFNYSHCFGGKVACDKENAETLTFKEWKEIIDKKVSH